MTTKERLAAIGIKLADRFEQTSYECFRCSDKGFVVELDAAQRGYLSKACACKKGREFLASALRTSKGDAAQRGITDEERQEIRAEISSELKQAASAPPRSRRAARQRELEVGQGINAAQRAQENNRALDGFEKDEY